MPTILTHLAVPIAASVAFGAKRLPLGAVLVGMAAAVVPDLDVITFKLGIAYGGITGHRGFTHTILFAALFGLIGYALAPYWKMRRWTGYVWIALCTLSHPLLDMLTDGGVGIPLFSPLDGTHYFFPWRPIVVSPISLKSFLSARGAEVLYSELLFVWLPLMAMAFLTLGVRRGLLRQKT